MNPNEKNIRIVKNYLKSPKIHVRGILEFVMVLSYLIACFSITGIIKDSFALASHPSSDAIKAGETFSVVSVVMMIICAVPFILIGAAYLMIWFKSKNDAPDSVPSTGVSILNGFAIVQLIIECISGAIMVFSTIINIVSGYKKASRSSNYSFTAAPTAIMLLLLMVGLTLLPVIFYKMYLGSISKSLRTPELKNNGAKAYGIISVLRTIGVSLMALYLFSFLFFWEIFLRNVKVTSQGNKSFISLIMKNTRLICIPLMIFLLLRAAIYFFDAMIAFGYSDHISEASLYPDGYPVDKTPQQPYSAPYVSADNGEKTVASDDSFDNNKKER